MIFCFLIVYWDLFMLLLRKFLLICRMELLLWCCFVSFKKDSIFGGVCEMWINLNVGLMKEKGWKILDWFFVVVEVMVFFVVWRGVVVKDGVVKGLVYVISGVCRYEDIVLFIGIGEDVEFEIRGVMGWFVIVVFNCCFGMVIVFCKIGCVFCNFCGMNLLLCMNVIIWFGLKWLNFDGEFCWGFDGFGCIGIRLFICVFMCGFIWGFVFFEEYIIFGFEVFRGRWLYWLIFCIFVVCFVFLFLCFFFKDWMDWLVFVCCGDWIFKFWIWNVVIFLIVILFFVKLFIFDKLLNFFIILDFIGRDFVFKLFCFKIWFIELMLGMFCFE